MPRRMKRNDIDVILYGDAAPPFTVANPPGTMALNERTGVLYMRRQDMGSVPIGTILDVAGGVARMGAFIMQWGSASSTQDSAEAFSFNEDFPNACFMATVIRTSAGAKNVLPVTAVSASSFTINRDDAIDGSQPFDWFAIGY